MTPIQIKEIVDAKIFGQEAAKKMMSLAFYMHLTRNGLIKGIEKNTSLPKPTVLLLGNPGSGKTLLTHTLCSYFQLPIINIDGGLFLTTPNVGEMLDAYLRYLILQFGLEKASTAIFCIDGFDNLCNPQQTQPSISAGIQQDILQMIEQKERMLIVEQGKEPILFPMHQLLFIFSGRFIGIESFMYMRAKIANAEDDVMKRKQERLALIEEHKKLNATTEKNNLPVEQIGFNTQSQARPESEANIVKRKIQALYDTLKEDELEQLVEHAFQKELVEAMQKEMPTKNAIYNSVHYTDLTNYGMLPELAGRLSFIAKLDQLSIEDIVAIIKKTENNIIQQFTSYFSVHADLLEIEEEVYTLIAKEVVNRKIGTRSIDAIIIQLLEAILYSSPNGVKEKFVIDTKLFSGIFPNSK